MPKITPLESDKSFANPSEIVKVENGFGNHITLVIDENHLNPIHKRAVYGLLIDNNLITLSEVYGTMMTYNAPHDSKYLIPQLLQKSLAYASKTKTELLEIALHKIISDCAYDSAPDKAYITQLSVLLPIMYPEGNTFEFEDETRREFVGLVVGKMFQATMMNYSVNYDFVLLEQLVDTYFLFDGCEPGFFGRLQESKRQDLIKQGFLKAD